MALRCTTRSTSHRSRHYRTRHWVEQTANLCYPQQSAIGSMQEVPQVHCFMRCQHSGYRYTSWGGSPASAAFIIGSLMFSDDHVHVLCKPPKMLSNIGNHVGQRRGGVRAGEAETMPQSGSAHGTSSSVLNH
eukprot:4176175-Amphidinium_carterae.1